MYPKDLRYTRKHEWARLEEDGMVTVGITAYACEELSDIVYVELPPEGKHVDQGAAFATLESVKAVSEVYAPVTGTIATVNQRLRDDPGLLNEDPYGNGWIVRVHPGESSPLEGLMDAEAYAQFVEAEKGAQG